MDLEVKLTYLKKELIRIDLLLASLLNVTRSYIAKLIKQNLIYVNNELVTKPGFMIKFKNEISVFKKPKEDNHLDLKLSFSIIYEDEYLMVVNKPRGLLSHATSFAETDHLVNQIKQYYLQKQYQLNDLISLRNGLVHRLDKDTAGLLLVAKRRDVFNLLKNDIDTKQTKRFYYALVKNPFSNMNHIKINLPLAHNNKDTKMIIDKNGKEAITIVKPIINLKNYSLVECELLTGRTHQIRAHLSAINHPIYNDPLYGQKIDETGQYLFAHKLVFIHPISKKVMEFDLGQDKILQEKMKELEHE